MSRYAAECERIAQRLTEARPGVGIVQVPPGEQALIANTIAARVAPCPVQPLDSELLRKGPPRAIVPGLPREQESRSTLLMELNGRRDWITSHGRQLLLVVDRYELVDLQRLAGDVYSAQIFVKSVSFEPDTSVDLDEARRTLSQWQKKRFGYLDLRGFIRSESEDVSWSIEDIYQDIKATPISTAPGHSQMMLFGATGNRGEKLSDHIESLISEGLQSGRPIAVLGHPGSGKTFFLRWMAMRATATEEWCGMWRPLPLLLSLSTYVQMPGPATILDCIVERLLIDEQPAAHVLRKAISEGRVLFLLDGMDEVGDTRARQRIAEALRVLVRKVRNCPVIITSRIAGYSTMALKAHEYRLDPFDDEDIQNFLVRWCELYAQDRLGKDPAVQRQGREEGAELAKDVLANPGVCGLARSPLLLTVLAVVHRTGVRLPDHRVELYEHATRVLVERWNRIRSLSGTGTVLPLKAADAARLLGPVALQIIRTGARGAIKESALREMLEHALSDGSLRGVTTADEALDLFRNSLGLLIEQGPGLFSFLHLTLAEFFTAWELVRSGELEQIAAEPPKVYAPEWREILLLAAGVLGILQAADRRQADFINALLKSAERMVRKPSPAVPSLLGGLLVDDPGLPLSLATRVIHALIPQWWFACRYASWDFMSVTSEAVSLASRIANGRFADIFRARLENLYTQDALSSIKACDGFKAIEEFPGRLMLFLMAADIDPGPVILHLLDADFNGSGKIFLPTFEKIKNERLRLGVMVSRWLIQEVRASRQSLRLFVEFKMRTPGSSMLGSKIGTIDWEGVRLVDNDNKRVYLEFDAPVDLPMKSYDHAFAYIQRVDK